MCSNKMAYYKMDVAKEFDFHPRAIFLILVQLTPVLSLKYGEYILS